jgi:hypothetical protein
MGKVMLSMTIRRRHSRFQNSQLAVLPGTTHVTLVNRADWLLSMIPAFLDVPMTEAK